MTKPSHIFCLVLILLSHVGAEIVEKNIERRILRGILQATQHKRGVDSGVYSKPGKLGDVVESPVKLSKRVPSSCTPEYEALGHSTMCEYEDDPEATNIGLSEEDKLLILEEHNRYRGGVQPAAKNMQKVYYDEEIAKIAQKWATHCPDLAHAHDTADNRLVPGYGILVGQNYAYGYPTWTEAIKVWYDEVNDYEFGRPDQDFYYTVLITHYTQVVTAVSSRIGCGFAVCPHGPTYVCNYSFGNDYDLGHPYLDGERCGDCPSNCADGLCDCGGKFCRNGGTLEIGSCTCNCAKLYTGETCETLECPPRDEDYCGEPQPYGYEKENCDWTNVPEECPFMCGLCTGPQEEADDDHEWKGHDVCQDHSHCGEADFGYVEENCDFDVVKDNCPAMCDACDEEGDRQLRLTKKEADEEPKGGSDEECKDHPDCGNDEFSYVKDNCEIDVVKEYCPAMCDACDEKGSEAAPADEAVPADEGDAPADEEEEALPSEEGEEAAPAEEGDLQLRLTKKEAEDEHEGVGDEECKDHPDCGNDEFSYVKDNCDRDVVKEYCPAMCDACDERGSEAAPADEGDEAAPAEGGEEAVPAEEGDLQLRLTKREAEEEPEGGGDEECKDHPDCGNDEFSYVKDNCEIDVVKKYCPAMCDACDEKGSEAAPANEADEADPAEEEDEAVPAEEGEEADAEEE